MARRTLAPVIAGAVLLLSTPRPLADPAGTLTPAVDRPAPEAPWWWGHRPGASQAATPSQQPPTDPAATSRVVPAAPWVGVASWYAFRAGAAAAGPELRAALGRVWRGSRVRVCAGGRCVEVVLADWCACPGGRLIDLAAPDFAELAPLSRGLVRVAIRRVNIALAP